MGIGHFGTNNIITTILEKVKDREVEDWLGVSFVFFFLLIFFFRPNVMC